MTRNVEEHVGHDVRYFQLGWTSYRATIVDDGEVKLGEVEYFDQDIEDSILRCLDCDMNLTEWQV